MLHQLNPFQWIVVPFLSLLFLHSLALVARGSHWRREGMRAILWFAAAVAVLRPEMTITIAKAVGIGRGTDLILYLFILGFLGASFYFYGRVVKLEMAITSLVRQAALQDKAKS
jgi:small membrane protein